MGDEVALHYCRSSNLADAIAARLKDAGKDIKALKPSDLAAVDEFHIRGRKATLELAEKINPRSRDRLLDIGCGLGGPARTVAEAYGCHVTGVDLTQEFCEVAEILSDWVGLGDLVDFQQGDATNLPFSDNSFDAAMTIHAAMNIAAKDRMYEQARRVVKPAGTFVVYDVLQGEGGDVLFPVPWAREPSISHLATPDEMQRLLKAASFDIREVRDSTEESQAWFEEMAARMARSGPLPVTFNVFLGDDYPEMVRNQVRNLTERRIRTVCYVCRA